LIDCIVNLPAKLFLNTQIPAALWFMNRARGNGHPRKNEILFIDARNLGHLINRRTRELSAEDIQQITGTYHAWRTGEGEYADIKGFCASVPVSRVQELGYVLTPGRYVGLPDEEDDFNFAERFTALKAEFEAQLLEETALNKAIAENLAKVKV
jgi:type I restriction enzyme M protein